MQDLVKITLQKTVLNEHIVKSYRDLDVGFFLVETKSGGLNAIARIYYEAGKINRCVQTLSNSCGGAALVCQYHTWEDFERDYNVLYRLI